MENADHLGRARHKAVHEPGVEEVAVGDAVLDDAAGDRLVEKLFQGFFEIHVVKFFCGLFVVLLAEAVEKKVDRVSFLDGRQKAGLNAVGHKLFNSSV